MAGSTTTRSGFAQPAVIGGVAMGALSALPLIGAGNCCCCLWVISGGLLAAYLLQADRAAPIAPADGLLVGLLAGLIGAVVYTAISIPLNLVIGPWERNIVQRLVENAPPDVRDSFERVLSTDRELSGTRLIIRSIVGLIFWACAGGIFGSIGGVLGAAIFKKPLPPGPIDVPNNP